MKSNIITRRLLSSLFAAGCAVVGLGQTWQPTVGDFGVPVSDIPGVITSGSGYDLLSGQFQRSVVDMAVPGALGKFGLQVQRRMQAVSNEGNHKWVVNTYTNCFFEAGMVSRYEFLVVYPNGNYATFVRQSGTSLPVTVLTCVQTSDVLFVNSDTYASPAKLVMTDGTVVTFESPTSGAATPPSSYISGVKQWYGSTLVTDPNGLQTTISFGAGSGLSAPYNKQIHTISDQAGRHLTFNWGTDGFLQSVTGSNGDTVSYVWDKSWTGPWAGGGENRGYGMLTQVNYADGTSANYTYVPSENTGVFYSPAATYGPSGVFPDTLSDVRTTAAMPNVKLTTTTELSRYYLGSANYHPTDTKIVVSAEKTIDGATAVSTRTLGTAGGSYVETRGDGVSRTFTYSGASYARFDAITSQGNGAYSTKVLTSATDFLGHTTTYNYGNITGVQNSLFLLLSVTDPLGRVTTMTRTNPYGLVTKITRPDNSTEILGYTLIHDAYYLTSRTDENGHTTSCTRYPSGVVQTISYPDGSSESWTGLNSFNQPTVHQFRNGATETMAYDSSGRLTSRSTPYFAGDSIGYTTFTYYPSGNVWQDRIQTVTDPLGHATTYEYDRAFSAGTQGTTACSGRGCVTKITYADGNSQTFGFDIYGNKVWEKNELGQTTSYTYDAYNRMTGQTDPLGRTTQVQYQHSGFSENPLAHTVNKPRVSIAPSGRRKGLLYDANFNLTSETAAETTTDASTTSYTYDAVGNPSQLTDPAGRVTTYVYNNRNRRTAENAPLSRTTSLGYDAVGNLTSVTYPDGTGISKQYNVMNQLSSATDEMLRTTSYVYYGSGKLQRITDPKSNTYEYVYDAANRMTTFKLTNPTQTGFDTEQTTYDLGGNIATFRNRSGSVKTLVYDNRNRETSFTWNDGVTPGTTTIYDGAGRVTQKANSASTLTYSYDFAGQLTQEQQSVAGTTARTVQYSYDADGNRTVLKAQ